MLGVRLIALWLPQIDKDDDRQCLLRTWRRWLANKNNDMTTFRCDFSKFWKPIGPVIRHNSWETYMGFPMVQTVESKICYLLVISLSVVC